MRILVCLKQVPDTTEVKLSSDFTLQRDFIAQVMNPADESALEKALALRDQFAPPTIHYAQPDPECDLDYVPNTGRAQAMTYALSNSLGFGGHNACIALRRWEG